jgi:hypothetical protein
MALRPELQIAMPTFGIKSTIFRFDALKALSNFRDGPSNGEIKCLALDDEPVPTSGKYKVVVLWSNQQHIGTFA